MNGYCPPHAAQAATFAPLKMPTLTNYYSPGVLVMTRNISYLCLWASPYLQTYGTVTMGMVYPPHAPGATAQTYLTHQTITMPPCSCPATVPPYCPGQIGWYTSPKLIRPGGIHPNP